MKRVGSIVSAAVLAAIVSGCQTETGAYAPQNADRYNYESTAKVALMSKRMQDSVTVPEVQSTTLPDGRLQVIANLRNRKDERIEVQANCEFKNANGLAIDATPWQTLILTENSMETVQFASMNDQAKRYTIRIREAR